jgi:hypothetical protein
MFLCKRISNGFCLFPYLGLGFKGRAYPNPQSYNLYSPSDLPHLFPLSTFQMQERLLLPLGVYGYG